MRGLLTCCHTPNIQSIVQSDVNPRVFSTRLALPMRQSVSIHKVLAIPQIRRGKKFFFFFGHDCGLNCCGDSSRLLLRCLVMADRSQRGLRLDTALLAQCLPESIERVTLVTTSCQEVLALLALAHLLLHGDHLLLLGPAQREGDTEQ